MPGIEGILKNVTTAISSPNDWWLARQSIVRHGAIQHVDELARFCRMARRIRPRRILEIGTAQGGLFWLLCRLSRPDATLISVDLPREERYSGGLKIDVDLTKMKRAQQTVISVAGSSHEPTTLDRIRNIQGRRLLDLLFIDGDHSYEGVRQDYEMYRGLVRVGGLIAFHDIVQTKFENCEVDRFWAELTQKPGLQTTEIVGRTRSHFGGIGVITANR